MRCLTFVLCVLTTSLVSASENLPEELKPLAEAITRDVSGETIAWLLGGDAVSIAVANSPLYRESLADLEAVATDIAAQAVAFVPVPLESVGVSFHEGEVSEESEKTALPGACG